MKKMNLAIEGIPAILWGEPSANSALVRLCQTPSPGWSYSFVILRAHATWEGRSTRETGFAGPVQRCRKCGTVM